MIPLSLQIASFGEGFPSNIVQTLGKPPKKSEYIVIFKTVSGYGWLYGLLKIGALTLGLTVCSNK